ncbi:protein of unknown function [Paraburkholderia dioscoreae]|uniref:Uncharacterized protein n=1 Tax=Paraburkholderia dioscoreae TaxID=2604047 RepID=A0A5Q4YVI5_9BURK|nr:protein of unknown function [Paraburkholderia dioscoreae]
MIYGVELPARHQRPFLIADGLCRYLKEHRGEEPVERVLHPERKRKLCNELRMRHKGVVRRVLVQ